MYMHMYVQKPVLGRMSASCYWIAVFLTVGCAGFVKDCTKSCSNRFIRIMEERKFWKKFPIVYMY